MQNNTFIPLAFILVVGIAFYFIYGYLSPKSVDLSKYQALCDSYRTADANEYSADERQMLINEVGYLIPDELKELKSEQERKLKQCVIELAKQLEKQSGS